MKQFKTGLFVVVGLAFASLLAFMNLRQPGKTAAVPESALMGLPEQAAEVNQQLAVEVQPLPAIPAPIETPAPVTALPLEPLPALPTSEDYDLSGAQSFIAFSTLRENLDFQAFPEANWRSYREYRRSIAKTPEPK